MQKVHGHRHCVTTVQVARRHRLLNHLPGLLRLVRTVLGWDVLAGRLGRQREPLPALAPYSAGRCTASATLMRRRGAGCSGPARVPAPAPAPAAGVGRPGWLAGSPHVGAGSAPVRVRVLAGIGVGAGFGARAALRADDHVNPNLVCTGRHRLHDRRIIRIRVEAFRQHSREVCPSVRVSAKSRTFASAIMISAVRAFVPLR